MSHRGDLWRAALAVPVSKYFDVYESTTECKGVISITYTVSGKTNGPDVYELIHGMENNGTLDTDKCDALDMLAILSFKDKQLALKAWIFAEALVDEILGITQVKS